MAATPDRCVVELSTPTGLVDVAVGSVVVTDHTIAADFEAAAEVHDRALSEGWFHLGPLSSGAGARPFGAGGDVRLHARLDPAFVLGLRLVTPTAAGVTELLTKLDVTSPLRSQASWYACSATREIPLDAADVDPDLAEAMIEGSLREGYRTAWAGDVEVLGLPIIAVLAEQVERRFHDVTPLVDTTGFGWTLSGRDATWTTNAVVDESAGRCSLYSVLGTPRPATDRDALVERANDLNTALLYGAWHVAADTPTVGFRSSTELPDRVGAPALVDRLVTRHLDIVDEYASAFA